MNDGGTTASESGIELECELSDPPEKVWRAVSIPEFVGRWWPEAVTSGSEVVSVVPGDEIRYRLRDGAPPFVESSVTIRIAPNGSGGTTLRVMHAPADERLLRAPKAVANANRPPLMRAA